MANPYQQIDKAPRTLAIRCLRGLGIGMTCGAIVLSTLGCVRSDHSSLSAYTINSDSFAMPSSTVFLVP